MVLPLHNSISKMLLLITLSLIGVSSNTSIIAYGALADELQESTNLVRENTRTINRVTDFIVACTNLAKSGDNSMFSTCDSVIQKFNIEIGQFHSENRLVIEDLAYPYTIPSHAESTMSLDSAKVTGSSIPSDLVNHGSTALEYNGIIGTVIDECVSIAEQFNVQEIGKCIDLYESLNGNLRTFNTNAGAEINKVLAADSSSSLSGSTGFD